MKTHVKFACLLMMLTREPFLFYTYMKVTLSSIRSLLQKSCPLAMQRRKWLWSAGYPSQQHLPVMELLENQLNLWTLTYLDIFGALTVEDFLHITTSLQYTQFCKCFLPELQSILSKVLCKFSLVFKAFEINIPWQQRTQWRKYVWATYFLSKTTLGC